eukprot:gnl/Hemi2/12224_TR4175_c0_g1_i1.p1 gnl/Hemi2/12224_TR4175_c0_g1~~gnl/Hemi2/12224_TR4175_c0_g1_i1.p1  ORF type:complete len:438 (-),score=124.14 gnl/Hemi2/12224_TR4175_c0_g1_i1:162-1475(-)
MARPRIIATVATGLEYVAVLEVQDVFRCTADTLMSGKVLFELPDAEDATLRSLHSLRSVEHLFSCVSITRGIRPGAEGLLDLEAAPQSICDDDWARALGVWRHNSVLRGGSPPPAPKFRVTTQRGGTHAFDSTQLGQRLAAGIAARLSLQAEVTDYDVEFFAHLHFDVLYLSVCLTLVSVSIAMVAEDRALGCTALKPSIAYSLARVAAVPFGGIGCDPMCGCGTIPELAAQCFPGTFWLAGDNNNVAAAKSEKNLMHCGYVDFIRWDVRRLPLRAGVLSAIATDMPFGKRVGTHHGNQQLYPLAAAEFLRVLEEGGRAAMLSTEHKILMQTMQKKASGWTPKRNHQVNVGGLNARLFLFEKHTQSRRLQNLVQYRNMIRDRYGPRAAARQLPCLTGCGSEAEAGAATAVPREDAPCDGTCLAPPPRSSSAALRPSG